LKSTEDGSVNVEIDYARRLTDNVLAQLGEEAPDWRIATVGYLQIDHVTIDSESTNTIRVELESPSKAYSPVSVDFSLNVPLADATRELAGQIQDHAVEATGGASIPPCPGHQHPSMPRLVNGVPQWVCPKQGADHYARGVLPRFDPRYTLAEYMRDNQAHT
jgi:hypothetical protein